MLTEDIRRQFFFIYITIIYGLESEPVFGARGNAIRRSCIIENGFFPVTRHEDVVGPVVAGRDGDSEGFGEDVIGDRSAGVNAANHTTAEASDDFEEEETVGVEIMKELDSDRTAERERFNNLTGEIQEFRETASYSSG